MVMSINTVVGQVARGDDFFVRPKIISELWRQIESESSILITAPRRVGKTSLLSHFEDNPKEGYRLLYIITESVNSEKEFFRKLYTHIFQLLNGINKFSQGIQNLVNQKKVKEITKNGIKLDDAELNYYDGLIKLFEILDLGGEKLIIMIDEFAETVENIIKDEDKISAKRFLQINRELRHSPILKGKIQFIYAGSIGLENVVSKINSSSTINDLYTFKLHAFSRSEAKELVYNQILKDSEIELLGEQFEYIIEKIDWLIPFYIQLLLDEIYKLTIFEDENEITNIVIDKAFDNAIEHRNYFDPWLERLRKSYKKNDFNFVKTLLNHTSNEGLISSVETYNLATEYKITETYKTLVNTLTYDGYINNNEDVKVYCFNSPLLKEWWNKNVAN